MASSSPSYRKKVCTKFGDQGETSLLYGGRVSKSDPHCEAWGITVEAVSALGLARALTRDARLKDTLKDLLFVAARYQDRDLSLERATGERIWILNAETRCFQHHRVDHCELFPGSRPAEWLRHQGCHSLSPARTWNFL